MQIDEVNTILAFHTSNGLRKTPRIATYYISGLGKAER